MLATNARCDRLLSRVDEVLWECPGCGTTVWLPIASDDGREVGDVGRARRDSVAHALCGCYVLTMSETALGRLLSSVLVIGAGDLEREEGGPEATPLV